MLISLEVVSRIVTSETGEDVVHADPLVGGGLVNRVFEVVTTGKTWIFRAGPGEDDYGIYRKEQWCVEQAARLGIPGPQDFRAGWFEGLAYTLYQKIEGTAAQNYYGERAFIWRRLGEYARRYHQLEAHGFGSSFSPLPGQSADVGDWLDYYLDYIFDTDLLVEAGLVRRVDWERSREAIERIRDWKIEPRLCHGNLALSNIIIGLDNEVYLIDWGTACGHLAPHIDLVEILTNHPDDEAGLAVFLDGYGMTRSAFEAERERLWTLQVWRLLTNMKWALQDRPGARRLAVEAKRQLDQIFAREP